MSKPDWSDAPENMNWVAQDANGQWWWYEKMPKVGACSWLSGGCEIEPSVEAKPSRQWRSSLVGRPRSQEQH